MFSPLWIVAGRVLGLVAVGGQTSCFRLLPGREFVVDHYEAQLPFFHGSIRELILEMMSEEDTHREDAAHRSSKRFAFWDLLVKKGCGLAVLASSRF